MLYLARKSTFLCAQEINDLPDKSGIGGKSNLTMLK